ncbi:MAG: sensor histidine kinase [Sphingomonas sp.]|uniref:sensor histidine kinase n=1 Tax=Sphingomonas sp. TaxID=28214 RepID=UPI0017C05137|nr:sensor histidine kinase [Sphingomonas sp.]MBA3666566.1 sensor histidine kinase [Sphingomonas sp.]
MAVNDGFSGLIARLPTPAKILLILSLALLPLGVASAWSAARGLEAANHALDERSRDQARVAAESMESLIARNTLAVRVAANAVLSAPPGEHCAEMQRILGIAPAVGREFALLDDGGRQLCRVGDLMPPVPLGRIAPGDFSLWASTTKDAIIVRAGVVLGSTLVRVPTVDLRDAVVSKGVPFGGVTLIAAGQELVVIPNKGGSGRIVETVPLASNQVEARISVSRLNIPTLDRLFIFLPLLMWAAAAIISWWMVHRLLIRPLRRLQGAVVDYRPGDGQSLAIPESLGPAREIHELGDAFQRAVQRIEDAEHEAREALEGQRRLVREVHHRVKNNLQVVASLLSIHGRSAEDRQAKAAYSSIGRRVDALSVVHRNHYAELEENRGIALRPLLTELSAGLKASAPAEARKILVELELDSVSTTQDVAVAAAFLITEMVEFAMLRAPADPIDISLRRESELTASLSISASVLVPDADTSEISKQQFERIVEGLARQLRSPLERKLGRYTVTLPIFPDR